MFFRVRFVCGAAMPYSEPCVAVNTAAKAIQNARENVQNHKPTEEVA